MDVGDFRAVQAELSQLDATLKRLHWDLQRAERLHANGTWRTKANGKRGALTIHAVTPQGVVEVAAGAKPSPKGPRPASRRRGR
ncbi:MAG TPA: hypothetical protein VGR28_06745 [Candidatus Thermoplasmatota archaeon]|jgi:hypothetical protein|nr:hypothetical protein [Candidatus Thermoplasmatota archaeon]